MSAPFLILSRIVQNGLIIKEFRRFDMNNLETGLFTKKMLYFSVGLFLKSDGEQPYALLKSS